MALAKRLRGPWPVVDFATGGRDQNDAGRDCEQTRRREKSPVVMSPKTPSGWNVHQFCRGGVDAIVYYIACTPLPAEFMQNANLAVISMS